MVRGFRCVGLSGFRVQGFGRAWIILVGEFRL